MNPRNSKQGFTLLEILIVTLLLAFLSISTFSSIRLILKDKETIDTESESVQEARSVYTVIERDISAAYLEHYEDFGWNPTPKPEDKNAPPPPVGQKPLPVTIFQGKNTEIFLSARSHQRMSENSPENEFHFVTYQMSGEKLVRAESERATSLKDRESPDRFKTFVLLDHVKSLKLTYWDNRNERWDDAWDSERAETQDMLPDAVKLEMEYMPEKSGDSKKDPVPVKLQTVIRITGSALRTLKR